MTRSKASQFFTFEDVPDALHALYLRSRTLAEVVAGAISSCGEVTKLPAKSQLMGTCDLALIRSGTLVLTLFGKRARFYSDGDFISCEPFEQDAQASLTSDFAVSVVAFDNKRFREAVCKDAAVCASWLELKEVENRLMQGLCAARVSDSSEPRFVMARFEPGHVIVEAGVQLEDVLVLIEGKAAASVGGVEVGTIGENEAIGEMSFLAGTATSARVVAVRPCLVQRVPRSDFAMLTRQNPELMMGIARTLAQRLARRNDRAQL